MPPSVARVFAALIFLAVVAIAVTVFLILTARAGDRLTVDTAIVFVTDVSGSMKAPEVAFVRRAHAEALVSDAVAPAIGTDAGQITLGLAYVEFGETAEIRVGWHLIDGPDALVRFSGLVGSLGEGSVGTATTKPGSGLMAALAAIDAMPFEALRIVVDVVGDGQAMDPGVVKLAAADLVSRDAVVNALPLMIDPDSGVEEYYRANIAAGPGAFVMPLTALGDLPETLRQKIALEIY